MFTRQPLDVVIVGAGVVGAACAHYVSRAGPSVAVVDRGPVAGGTTGAGAGNLLVSDTVPGPGLRARRLVPATGVYERQLPFRKRTLTGVVGAAGAQAMLKSGHVLPRRRIVGAELAVAEGELAALSVVHEVRGGIRRDVARRAVALSRSRRRLCAFAALMGAVHRPGADCGGWLTDDTEVCRCEEAVAGRIRDACERLRAGDSRTVKLFTRTVKLFTRAGMGWCRGRTCGFAVREPAAVHSAPPGVGRCPERPDRRPSACPVKLSELVAEPADPG
ncbi:FAD-dependent oxidoreductase [Streptomyces sp. NPDC001455]|uniref:FAD-dependent oxidoreductase n=1 Tax=unclassified Streptomyces TaxID=2593676 RepID=UPI0033268A46